MRWTSRSLTVIVSLLLFTFPLSAAFTHYTQFDVTDGQVPSAQANDAAVIKVANDTRWKTTGNGGRVANASGFDIRPHANNSCSSALTFQLVPGTYDGTNGTFEMNVLIASLSDTTTIYLCYGDAGLSSDGSSTSTFNANTKLVYHMSENAANTTVADSTSGANTGTASANTSTITTTGKIDGGFAVTTQSIDAANESNFDFERTNAFSISMWLNYTAGSGSVSATAKEGTTGNAPGYVLNIDLDNTRPRFFLLGTGGASLTQQGGGASISAGSFHHVVITYDGSSTDDGMKIYVDGTNVSTTTGGTLAESILNDQALRVGGNPAGLNFVGSIDESKVYNVEQTANWVTTRYRNENAPTTFWTIGSDTPLGCTPHHLTYTAQPSNAVVGGSLGTVSVGVYDSGSVLCSSATNEVTLANSGGTCTGMTLNSADLSISAVSGIATWNDLSETVATGSCTLAATAAALTGATSNAFTISAAAATKHLGMLLGVMP